MLFRVVAILPIGGYLGRVWSSLVTLLHVMALPVIILVRPREWMRKQFLEDRKTRRFGRDTWQLFRRVALEDGDIVFIPTLNEREMLGLLKYFKRDARSANASWHLLFRRNIYRGRDPEYAAQDEQTRELRSAFQTFDRSLTGQRVVLWTDSAALTHQYSRLLVREFRTLPIPVGADYRRTEREPHHDRMRVVYVGDARTEKGYPHLPELVQHLLATEGRKTQLEFGIQSNFNLRDGDPGSAVARAQLEAMDSARVEIYREALTSAEYRALMSSGDLVLVLYDRDNYYARSSGIFVEAMVAGLPVVIPAGLKTKPQD